MIQQENVWDAQANTIYKKADAILTMVAVLGISRIYVPNAWIIIFWSKIGAHLTAYRVLTPEAYYIMGYLEK